MDAPVQVGQVVGGKYEVERILARGGVGVVVKAKHLQLLEPCAIKFLLPESMDVPLARERFAREARACARLKSDHVVKVFDIGDVDGELPYMVLEYLEGVDLDDHMADRPLPVPEASLYVLQICAALAEAHALGIVHRDIKPANVFLARLADGTKRVKLLDFGISKVPADPGVDQARTMAGTIMGTPYFMAPEQVRGEPVDARTDIWAVGVLFYYALTARMPFAGDIPTRTLAQILTCEPAPPSVHLRSLPPPLEAIILRCLEKSPERRPQTVHEIVHAVAPYAAEEGAPISRHVRRIFESSADGRASPEVAVVEVSGIARGPRPRLRVAAKVAACLAVAAAAALLAPRGGDAGTAPPTRAAGAARGAEAATLTVAPPPPLAPPANRPTAEPVATSRTQEAEAPPARPAPEAPPPQPSPSTQHAPVPHSAGFDLGSRF